jgi:non-specific serine/threonine protein kinase/serine/threonine-protein kinase
MKDASPEMMSIFCGALERTAGAARSRYLEAACGNDSELRARIDVLLKAHAEAGGLSLAATIEEPIAAGTVIGPYKLLEQIGEGGFGVVFMAEQTEPVRRKVALKVLKPGMDTRQVVARFEAERQALAIMDHPNIAKVFDGGATPSGRPFFVMELVKGVPITEYCDRNHLAPRQRLELFFLVCQAVQHAHQKAIIHRDLKPSNILVVMHDTTPVPKVIDFGVAKALGEELTDKTLFTGFAQMVGTPLYMSPEQAGQSGLDVDTRSDIYSLGVLLYELLTGTTPFHRERFREAAYDEIRRIIREEEPPRPSTRLSASTDSLPSISANRHMDPAKLTKLVRGDLDWIVMKALEKDRNRRYETANGFAIDVKRYLNDEPVLACPPSAGYRLRKFVRRNKKTMATATAFLLLLLAATGTSIGLATWAISERDHADEQKQLAQANEKEAKERAEELRTVLDFVDNRVFAAARPLGQDGGLGRDVTLRQAMESALASIEESFRDQPLIEARLRTTIGATFLYLGDGKSAEAQYVRARDIRFAHLGPEHPDTLAVMNKIGAAYYAQGRYRDALELQTKTLELQKATLGSEHRDTLLSMSNVAVALSALAHPDEAAKILEEVIRLQKDTLGPDHVDTLRTMTNLAIAYRATGRLAEASEFAEETLRRRIAKHGPSHPDTLRSRRVLARIYATVGRQADAFTMREETLQLFKDKLGPDHPETLLCIDDLADSFFKLDRHEKALQLREETLPLMKAKFGTGHETLYLMDDLARSYEAVGRHEDAEKIREEIRQCMKTKHGAGRPKTSDGK